MSAFEPPFFIRHARWALVPAILNFYFAYLLWWSGVSLPGACGAGGVPIAVLICLYWILRDGSFFDPKREEGDKERLISHNTKPKHYWTIVILCLFVYSGMTFVTGVAALRRTIQ